MLTSWSTPKISFGQQMACSADKAARVLLLLAGSCQMSAGQKQISAACWYPRFSPCFCTKRRSVPTFCRWSVSRIVFIAFGISVILNIKRLSLFNKKFSLHCAFDRYRLCQTCCLIKNGFSVREVKNLTGIARFISSVIPYRLTGSYDRSCGHPRTKERGMIAMLYH